MSLYGALYSGVSGLTAQSSKLGAIASNTANVNTIGFKKTNINFATLVTKQSSLTTFSGGGINAGAYNAIDVQGLLTSTSVATDLGISGSGFFVVSDKSNPKQGGMWAYTRAGSFRTDQNGYLSNSGGFYLQAWPLMPYDGSPNATTVMINDILYMKAYKDDLGITHYVNDNIIDQNNLKPINLNTIGGSATPTRQVQMGANLPAGDEPWSTANPDSGRYAMSALIYDSLGNSHNLNVQFTKETTNSWGTDIQIPPGASSVVLYSDRETTNSPKPEVYAAAGQLEFRDIPSNHSVLKISTTVNGAPKTYVYEFTTDGTTTYSPVAGETVVPINIQSGVVSIVEAVNRLQQAVARTMPSGSRFTLEGERLIMRQSIGGEAVSFDASQCIQCKQSSANPNQVTGVPTGKFEVPQIAWDLKNVGVINFNSSTAADYAGKSFNINNQTYKLVNGADPASNYTGQTFTFGGTTTKSYILTDDPSSITPGPNDVIVDIRPAMSGTGPAAAVDLPTLINQLTAAINAQVSLDPNEAPADGTALTIGTGSTHPYTVSNTGGVISLGTNQFDINIASAITGTGPTAAIDRTAMVASIMSSLYVNAQNPERFTNMGTSIEFTQPETGADLKLDFMAFAGVADGKIKDQGQIGFTDITTKVCTLQNNFIFNGQVSGEKGSLVPGVRFNSDGTPKYFNVNSMAIEWANGAQDMTGVVGEGALIDVFLGNVNTADGLTNLAGAFNPGYIKQDGSKYGTYAGVSISEDGTVIAMFNNGQTRAIAQIPLATFVNPNGLESMTGNAWYETDYSGAATLKTGGTGGAGEISQASLESSTVDVAEEFTDMIITQRAYSAASKSIITADEMLTELMNIKR